MKNANRSALLGAAFLMATSAIGPGFITQTAVFTQSLFTSFGFIILCSILLDIAAQLNIWRIIAVSERKGPDIANAVLPGSGYLLALLVAIGGLAFNIGNVAGAGLGINAMVGVDIMAETDALWAAILSAVIGIVIFWLKEIGNAIDWFAKLLGFVMIGLTAYVAIVSHPPVMQAVKHTFWPEKIDEMAIVTLVGGTVGGYISFAGAHRLLDAGITGRSQLRAVSNSSIKAILLASTMRILLFLATLGVVAGGVILNKTNPAASVFQSAAGEMGYRIFGLVLWCAAITSIVGSAYTSVTFLRSVHPIFEKYQRISITIFIIVSTIIFAAIQQPPASILVIVGTLNGFILPIGLALMLLAVHNQSLMRGYKHPVWLQVIGWIVVIVMTWMVIKTLMAF